MKDVEDKIMPGVSESFFSFFFSFVVGHKKNIYFIKQNKYIDIMKDVENKTMPGVSETFF